jgi:hypothetical protein
MNVVIGTLTSNKETAMHLIGTDWETLYFFVDNFCQFYESECRSNPLSYKRKTRNRLSQLSNSEIITILVAFQLSGSRNFKHFYTNVSEHHRREFPKLLTYKRFVALMPRVTMQLFGLLIASCGECTGISFIDSTVLRVCHIKRASRNKVFDGLAAKSKSTMGWFFGFKLHLLINERGELLSFRLTSGNVDDREPVKKGMLDNAWGKVFADKGYISEELFQQLMEKGIKLVTGVRKNMKNALVLLEEKLLLRKRSISETVNDYLKNVCQIEHSRHRSPANFLVHLMSGLVAYAIQPSKPSLRMNSDSDLQVA